MENVRNRINKRPIDKDEDDKMAKWQSNLTINGNYKGYENSFTYTFN